MLKTPNDGTEAGPSVPFPPFNANFALQAFQPMMAEKACTSLLEINQHWTSFLTKRFQEDTALVHQLAHCTSPPQVLSVYSDFFQKAVADYSREFAEMTGRGQAWFTNATACAQQALVANGNSSSERSGRHTT